MSKDQTGDALKALCEVRLAAERQAEDALARAVVELRRARDEEARLAGVLASARARRDEERRREPTAGAAAVLQLAQSYRARLEAATRSAERAVEVHAQNALHVAATDEAHARDQHERAARRREAVERAITRRQAARRRAEERREAAAADDLAARAAHKGREL